MSAARIIFLWLASAAAIWAFLAGSDRGNS